MLLVWKLGFQAARARKGFEMAYNPTENYRKIAAIPLCQAKPAMLETPVVFHFTESVAMEKREGMFRGSGSG